jgi:predicted O-methyltransferase YrrM
MIDHYRASIRIPPLVQQANELATRTGFTKSCLPQVGRMLYLLTSMYPDGCIGELGTGCGVGAAWIVSALKAKTEFYSIEHDLDLVTAARFTFSAFPNVHILHGRWSNLLRHAPFDLLFVDVSEPKQTMPDVLFSSLRVGGTLVVDDMTPDDQWSPEKHNEIDPVRQRLFNGADLAAYEIFLPPNAAMILATRRE